MGERKGGFEMTTRVIQMAYLETIIKKGLCSENVAWAFRELERLIAEGGK